MAADHISPKTRSGFGRVRQALSGGGLLPTALACLALAALAAVLARCAFYGIHTPDEGFYITVPYRIFYGDALLIDEMQESQFSAFLQYLPFALFYKITGSTDGIVLFFRLLFVFCQTVTAVFIFFKMKRFGVPSALCSAAMFLSFVPEFVESLDYYTLSLMPSALIAVLLFTSDRISVPRGVLIGILSACAVVAQPLFSVLYFAYTLAVLIGLIRKKRKRPAAGYLSLRLWGSITAGVAVTAALFFAFLLSRASLSDYIRNFGNLFSGYDHVLPFTGGQGTTVLNYGVIFTTLNELHPVVFPVSLALTAALLADVRRVRHRSVWCVVLGAFYLFYVIFSLARLPLQIDQGMFSPYIPFLFTLHCYVLTKRKNRKLLYIWLTGLVYVLFFGAISQALRYAGAVGCAVSNLACAPAARDLILELRQPSDHPENGARERSLRNAAAVALTVACVIGAVGITGLNAGALFVSDRVNALLQWDGETAREEIASGPMKGITVSQTENAVYGQITADLGFIAETAPGRLYIQGQLPIGYMMNGSLIGSCSAYYVERFAIQERYFQAHPDRVPRAVYFPIVDLYTNEKVNPLFLQMFTRDYKKTHPIFADYETVKGEAGYILLAPDARE